MKLARKLSAYERALRSCNASRRRWRAAQKSMEASAARPVRTRGWKGAEISRIYSDWLASLLSPHDEIRGDLRTLRARARELGRNNAFAGAYVELVTTNVIGPHGMRLRAKTRSNGSDLDARVNAEIEERWREWAEGPVTADGRMSLVELSELALETVARDGEAFPRRIVGRSFPHGLALQLIDPDLVDDSYSLETPGAGPRVYMGVEVDRLGRRLAYHVLDYPYGPEYSGGGPKRVPASEVLHVYRERRANQMRGVTWMTRAMAPTKDLERYFQNELVASAAGAAKMGFITNEAGAPGGVQTDTAVTEGAAAEAGGAGAGTGQSRVVVEAEPGSIWELNPGQKFEGWSPDHPNTAFGDFCKIVIKWMARGYGVSYEALSGDLREVTYLSGRLGQLHERDTWRKLQQWWIRSFLQPVFDWWLESAMLSGELELPGSDWRRYRRVLWIPRGWDWVDPSKDAEGAEKLIGLKLTSRQRILDARGDDFLQVLDEIAAEDKEAEKRGISLELPGRSSAAPAKPASSSSGDDPEGEADPEDEDPDEGDYDADARAARLARKNGGGRRNGRVTNRVRAGA